MDIQSVQAQCDESTRKCDPGLICDVGGSNLCMNCAHVCNPHFDRPAVVGCDIYCPQEYKSIDTTHYITVDTAVEIKETNCNKSYTPFILLLCAAGIIILIQCLVIISCALKNKALLKALKKPMRRLSSVISRNGSRKSQPDVERESSQYYQNVPHNTGLSCDDKSQNTTEYKPLLSKSTNSHVKPASFAEHFPGSPVCQSEDEDLSTGISAKAIVGETNKGQPRKQIDNETIASSKTESRQYEIIQHESNPLLTQKAKEFGSERCLQKEIDEDYAKSDSVAETSTSKNTPKAIVACIDLRPDSSSGNDNHSFVEVEETSLKQLSNNANSSTRNQCVKDNPNTTHSLEKSVHSSHQTPTISVQPNHLSKISREKTGSSSDVTKLNLRSNENKATICEESMEYQPANFRPMQHCHALGGDPTYPPYSVSIHQDGSFVKDSMPPEDYRKLQEAIEHPDRATFDVLKTFDWVQGFASEGASITVYVDGRMIDQIQALADMCATTKELPTRFKIQMGY